MTITAGGTIRALVVGYGAIVKDCHLPLLRETPGVTVVGVVRGGGDQAEPGLPVYPTLDQALGQARPDLVVISTPHHLHYEQARACLERGCHVLVEKPMTLRLAESRDLVRLAERQGRLLVVGLQRRYEGFAVVFRGLAGSGRLGEIRLVHGLFAHRFEGEPLRGWRTDPVRAGAGIIDDSAVHLIDLLIVFAGGPSSRLQARVLGGDGWDLPHSFTCFFDAGDATVSACGSYLSPVNSVQEEVSIWGTKGALFARRFCREWNTDPPAVYYKSADGSEREEFDLSGLPTGKALPLRSLLAVLSGREPRDSLLTEGKDVLETHRVIEWIREQIEPGAA